MQALRAKRNDCVGGYDTYGRKFSDYIPSTVGMEGAVKGDMNNNKGCDGCGKPMTWFGGLIGGLLYCFSCWVRRA